MLESGFHKQALVYRIGTLVESNLNQIGLLPDSIVYPYFNLFEEGEALRPNEPKTTLEP